MREHEVRIIEMFMKGLHNFKADGVNLGALSECYNMELDNSYLKSYEPISYGFEQDYDLGFQSVWPLPRLFNCGQYLIFLNISELKVYFGASLINTFTLPPCAYWEVEAFNNYIVLLNRTHVLTLNLDTMALNYLDKTNYPCFITMANFNGQLFVGNITNNFQGCDENYICWSEVGLLDFTVKDSNIAGFQYMGDTVLQLYVLQRSVIVCCAKQIVRLTFEGTQHKTEVILRLGLLSLTSAGASRYDCLLIANDGQLYHITDDNIEILGYKQSLDLIANKIYICYDDYNSRFFIGDGIRSFVYKQILTECFQCVTSAISYYGFCQGIYANNSDTEIRLTTNWTDFYRSEIKLLHKIKYSGIGFNNAKAIVRSGNDYETDLKLFNPSHFTTLLCAGQQFRVQLQADDYLNTHLTDCVATVKYEGRHSKRGTSVN